MVKPIKTLVMVLIAGALGGFSSGILVWLLGALGVTPALGFHMVPDFSFGWISRRVMASAVWGLVFLIPIYNSKPVLKGAVLGILPWLSSILYVLPFVKGAGFLGLDLGMGTPIWTLFSVPYGGSPAHCFWRGLQGSFDTAPQFMDSATAPTWPSCHWTNGGRLTGGQKSSSDRRRA
ncbi:hypothetical protein [Profundibacter sp.]|uniref:hypothetical protein n=1 Tax=Profundibacter sp. TaxID=3101071 RepID=UPI003D10336A